MRTSVSHPLQIDAFALATGQVGMTLCPGRKGRSLTGPAWDRDLATDVTALRAWGADIVVTLVDTDELSLLGCADLGDAVVRAGMEWFHIPFPDTKAPHDDWHLAWREISPRLHRALEEGGKVLVHCKAGLERTALVATLLQCERGERMEQALRRVTEARRHARLLPAQERWLSARLREDDLRRRRMRGAFFGGAMGDILGAEIEFWSLDQIRRRFPDGVVPITRDFTDDTQMTLFTAEGLLCGQVRGETRGIGTLEGPVHHAYLRWLLTQGEPAPITHIESFGLMLDPRMQKRRAPGMTCLSALSAAEYFGQQQRNVSKGCGSLMRSVPLPLFRRDREALISAQDISGLTHGHQTAADSCAAFTFICHALLADMPLELAILDALELPLNEEVRCALLAALRADRDGSGEAVEKLGGGWIAEEALSIALYACLAAEASARGVCRVERALRIAVTHSGDSDSTGAIAGNILGLLYPDDVMAHPWRHAINGADLIDRLATDLWFASDPEAYDALFPVAAKRGLWTSLWTDHHSRAYPGV
ncbi:ADP-ribosylglycohydrolase family protein [Falsigemmobacter intermedius]|uniref:ADP-ribosylglycohydrolase family protein n=3 Tax=Falsigemmobacter intermedius TaxID=1553448 RepID=UPI0036147FC9